MRFEGAKNFLRANVARILCAGMIAIGAVVATPFSSFAAVTAFDMAQEVWMYDPSDGSMFLTENRNVADECEQYGWKRITADSVDAGKPVVMTQRMTAEQAKYKAKFVYMSAGYDEATALAMINSVSAAYEGSPDRWYQIAVAHMYCTHGAPYEKANLKRAEAIEKQMTGTVMMGTHQAISGYGPETESTATASTAAAGKKASSAAEEVDQLYASLIASGKTSEQAMAEVNAQLASIIAKYTK